MHEDLYKNTTAAGHFKHKCTEEHKWVLEEKSSPYSETIANLLHCSLAYFTILDAW